MLFSKSVSEQDSVEEGEGVSEVSDHTVVYNKQKSTLCLHQKSWSRIKLFINTLYLVFKYTLSISIWQGIPFLWELTSTFGCDSQETYLFCLSFRKTLHCVSTDSRPSGMAVDGLSTLKANILSAAGLVMVPLSVCNVQHSSVQNARHNPFTEWVPDTCQGSLLIMNATWVSGITAQQQRALPVNSGSTHGLSSSSTHGLLAANTAGPAVGLAPVGVQLPVHHRRHGSEWQWVVKSCVFLFFWDYIATQSHLRHHICGKRGGGIPRGKGRPGVSHGATAVHRVLSPVSTFRKACVMCYPWFATWCLPSHSRVPHPE